MDDPAKRMGRRIRSYRVPPARLDGAADDPEVAAMGGRVAHRPSHTLGRAVARARWLLLGDAPALLRDQLGTYAETMKKGDFARFRLGPPGVGLRADMVFDPAAAHQVLAEDAAAYGKDGRVFHEVARYFGNGLLMSDGARWRRHRRLVQPLFTRRRVSAYLGTVTDAAAALTAWVGEAAHPDGTVDMYDLATRYTLHVLGGAIFGEDIDTVAPVLRETVPVLNEQAARRVLAPLPLPAWLPTARNRAAERARRRLWGTVDDLVASRRRRPSPGADDLLTLLLAATDPDAGAGLDDGDVRDEALIFLVAGYETTAAALAFAFDLVARHPHVQDQVRAEVAAVTDGRPLGEGDLGRLVRTRQVVDEALRLYPPTQTLARRAVSDTKVGNCPVPAGRIMTVCVWGIHHHPAVWSEPDRFDPDRFPPRGNALAARDADDGHGRYDHLPFGGGPRSCIGAHLALAELVAAVAAVVDAHRLEAPAAVPVVDAAVTLRPHGGVPCRVTPLG